MASQDYIKAREEQIVQSTAYVRGLAVVLDQEVTLNDGNVYRENHPHWNLLRAHADDLKRNVERLITTLNKVL